MRSMALMSPSFSSGGKNLTPSSHERWWLDTGSESEATNFVTEPVDLVESVCDAYVLMLIFV